MWNLEIWSARHLLAELTRGRITGKRWSFSRDVNVRLVGLRIAFSTCQFHQTYSSAVRCSSLSASSTSGWTRVIVEKPFGRDSESSATLTRGRKQYLKEEQIFRYFDNYGIIRDIMQNHLLQIIALFAMETPISLDAEDIRNEKVKVLRSKRHLKLSDVIIGQYNSHTRGGVTYLRYIDDRTVPKDSLTPTLLQQLSLLIMRDGTVCLSL